MYTMNLTLEYAEQLLAFVGMTYEILRYKEKYFEVKIGSKHPVDGKFYGRVSIAQGSTLLEAIKNASTGIGIDWYSVAEKVTEAEWRKIARL